MEAAWGKLSLVKLLGGISLDQMPRIGGDLNGSVYRTDRIDDLLSDKPNTLEPGGEEKD